MRGRYALAICVIAVGSAAFVAWGWSRTQDSFDHLRHQRLFPTCEGCHRIQEDRVTVPEPSLCEGCHDGEIVREVDWPGPSREASNLEFNHASVLATMEEALGMDMPCSTCHRPPGGERMEVQRVVLQGCMDCHAPNQDHYVGAPCATCHIPLTEAGGYTAAQLRRFPKPADHDEDFLLNHGTAATENLERCSVCHARDLCSSCHVNAPSVAAIQSLEPDPRVAEIVAEREVTYPSPPSHAGRDWPLAHGEEARPDGAACATCHTQNSCRTCHVDPIPTPVQSLPTVPQSRAAAESDQQRGPGVPLERHAPVWLGHVLDFRENHQALAAGATSQCLACHTRNQCNSCHTGSEALEEPGRDVSRYHPADFMQQHSAAAFGRRNECATCHNPEAFCRDCHQGQGLVGSGRIDTGFHDEKATWVFGHGAAARQALESCATCHSQRDCLQCHSALGGRRVNPHGPGFDADKLASKNPALCLFCHRQGILDR